MDLYFRLAILKLDIPPLRERLEDLPDIVRSLLDSFTGGTKQVSDAVFPSLCKYSWPGNIRELDSLVKRYAVLLDDSSCDDALFLDVYENLKMDHSLVVPSGPQEKAVFPPEASDRTLKETIEDYERVIIGRTLKECNFSRRSAARKLGISVNTLWRKMNPAQESD
jgi:propionate catabolism operon transcriptional regulator